MRPLKKRLINVACSVFVMSTTSAYASQPVAGQQASFTGKVRGSGGGYNYRTHIITDDASVKPRLCGSDLSKKIFKLSGMRVNVSGVWVEKGKKKKRYCLDAKDFSLLKGSSGLNLVVGTLEKSNAGFKINGSDGKQVSLGKIPSGLRDLVGKKVFVEVNAMKGPTEAESIKIVSYGEHP